MNRFLVVLLCIFGWADAQAGAEEAPRSYGGWYSSGTRRTTDDAGKSVPSNSPAAGLSGAPNGTPTATGAGQIPTPIVPYHSALFSSSRNDLPQAPPPQAASTYEPAAVWNNAAPPVVDLGREFGVAVPEPANLQPAVAQPAVTNSVSSPTSTMPGMMNIIDAGELVPVNLPNASTPAPPAAVKPKGPKSTKAKPVGPTTDKLTPIRKPAEAEKKPAAGKARDTLAKESAAEKPTISGAERSEGARPSPSRPRDFSLPQPAIPLEGKSTPKSQAS